MSSSTPLGFNDVAFVAVIRGFSSAMLLVMLLALDLWSSHQYTLVIHTLRAAAWGRSGLLTSQHHHNEICRNVGGQGMVPFDLTSTPLRFFANYD